MFRDAPVVTLECLADIDAPTAKQRARELGFRRATETWQQLAADLDVDLVDITTPVALHAPMAAAAIAAGKHVYCEKPLALTAADAGELALAARDKGVITAVGFDHVRNPLISVVRDKIRSGALGQITHFRGLYDTDEYLDPDLPFTWRFSKESAGSGCLHDLVSHTINTALFLLGPIAEVLGHTDITIASRRDAAGSNRRVDTDDYAGFFARFANGAKGLFEASRIATGRKNWESIEITGSKGAIYLNLERMNELQIYEAAGSSSEQGFKTLLLGPQHGDYSQIFSGPAMTLGYNDLKVLEVRDVVSAIASGQPFHPDFARATEVNAVVDAVLLSARDGGWRAVAGADR
jgi:predicted dehydrogenase